MTDTTWHLDPRRAPTLAEGDELLYDLPGRIVDANTYGHGSNGIDYRSHWLRLVKAQYGGCFLLVKHGGGEQRFQIDYNVARSRQFFRAVLDDTQRYLLAHQLYDIHSKARREAEERVRREWSLAFIEKRITKKRRDGRIYVNITPAAAPAINYTEGQ